MNNPRLPGRPLVRLVSLRVLVALSGLVYLASPCDGQTFVEAWERRVVDTHYPGVMHAQMTLDTQGNIIVSGSVSPDGNKRGITVVKYTEAGIPVWTNRYDGPTLEDDLPLGITVDHSDNVFVTGWAYPNSVTLAYSPEGLPLWTNLLEGYGGRGIVAHSNKVFTLHTPWWGQILTAHSTSGVALWAATNVAVSGYAVAADASGNVFVTGRATNGPALSTVAYSAAGVALWTNSLVGDPSEAFSIDVDEGGRVFATGSAGNQCVTVAYANNGVPLWTNFYGPPAITSGVGWDVTTTTSGRVVVTGYCRVPGTVAGFDWFTVSYANDGLPLWTNLYAQTNLDDFGASVVADPAGNVYVTGGAGQGPPARFDGNIVTLCYSPSGVPLWTNVYNGPKNADDIGMSIQRAPSGNLFVCGRSEREDSEYDIVSLKYIPLPEGVSGVNRVRSVVPGSTPQSSTHVRFEGMPGNAYIAQRAPDPRGPWLSLSTNVAGTNGLWEIVDGDATNAAGFYRTWVPW